MTGNEPSAIPAGWYPDPEDAARLRRWNGLAWTADVVPRQPIVSPSRPPEPVYPQPAAYDLSEWATLPGVTLPPDLSVIPGFASAPPVLPMPPSPPAPPVPPPSPVTVPSAPAPPPSGAQYSSPPAGIQYAAPPPPGVVYNGPPPGTPLATGAPAGMPPMTPSMTPATSPSLPPDSGYVPMARPESHGLGVTIATGTSTLAVWLIALLPLFHFAVIYLVFTVLAVPLVPGIQWGVLAAPAVFSLVFASMDRRRLVDKGHGELPSAVLAIVPPLYLLIRCFRVGARSIGPLLAWIVLQVAAGFAVVALMPDVLAAAIAR